MKKKKSICEFSSERSELLLKNFRESLARQSKITFQKAFKDAADAPAPRFWVSEARAVKVLRFLDKGRDDILEGMRGKKREMYLEIFRRVRQMRSRDPQITFGDAVFLVVNDTAPQSYITWQSAAKLIQAQKRMKRNYKL